MKKIVFFTLVVLAFTQCGKRKQYTTWKIDGQEFSSNEVEYTSNGRSISKLSLVTGNSRFALEFYLPNLPTQGNYLLARVNALQEQTKCVLSFGFDAKWYRISPTNNSYVEARSNNNKSQIILPPTWYFNNADSQDSVLIEGTFNEP